MNRKALFFYLASIISCSGFAQQTKVHRGPDKDFSTSLELFDKAKYASARKGFEGFLQSKPSAEKKLEAEYYRNVSALRLYHKDAEDLCDYFIEQNEGHYRVNLLRFEMGSLFYDEKDYFKSVKYLSRVDFSQISTPGKYEGQFKLGYSYFVERSFDNALPYLEKACHGTHKFTYAAYYYTGYLYFRVGRFDEALYQFKRAEGHVAYKNIVPYMKVSILQRQHKWNELASYADSVLINNAKIKNVDIIYMLAAEGHFRQDNYEKAATYFENYTAKHRNVDQEILYRLAYCKYKSGSYREAVESFKELALNDDTLTQHVAYYLGQCYLKLNNKEFALGAFRKAASVDYDLQIMEESMFNAAKLCYERKLFDEAIGYLEKLDERSQTNQAAKDLLSEAYLSTNNYDRAIKYIESQRYKSVALKTVYQKVSFFKAVEYFNNEAYEPALTLLDKSLDFTFDKEFEVSSNFWKAEIHSMRKEWDKAQNLYAFVFRNKSSAPNDYYIRSRYGIAYTYFNTDNYEKALDHFQAYTTSQEGKQDKKVYGDAMLRMADCHYKKRDFAKAKDEYKKALALIAINKDYAHFQLGVIEGKYLEGYANAKTNLNTVIEQYKTSPYIDDALYHIGVFHLEHKDYSDAIKSFTTLIDNHKGSSYEASAFAERALAYENIKNFNKALDDYKTLIFDYCLTKEASKAARSLPNVLAQLGKGNEIDQLYTEYENCNPANVETEELRFKNIENQFNLEKNYENVIQQGKAYLTRFPNTPLSNEINYYIAESYYEFKNKSEALLYYEKLISEPKFNYYTKALDRSGEINISNQNYAKAISSYEKLFRSSSSKLKQLNALRGLIKAHYEVHNYDSVIYYGNETIERLNSVIDARNNAKLYIGKSYLQKGDTLVAFSELGKLAKTEQDQYAAEAQYLLATVHSARREYKASTDTCYHLYQKFSAQQMWVGEGFLLIADNYIAQNELAQAIQVLESLKAFPLESIKVRANEKIESIATIGLENEEEKEVLQDSLDSKQNDVFELEEEEGGIEDE